MPSLYKKIRFETKEIVHMKNAFSRIHFIQSQGFYDIAVKINSEKCLLQPKSLKNNRHK